MLLAAVFACAFGLLGTTSLVQARPLVRIGAPPVQPDRTIAGHLYVSGDQFAAFLFFGKETLVRYSLSNGKPSSSPDLSYPTKPNTVGPVAVDSKGNVYAAVDCMTVNVFPPNKTTAIRSLRINLTCGDRIYTYGVITALAVDNNGYLFVSTHLACVSCAEPALYPRPSASGPLGDCMQNNNTCTLVYAPGASGKANPLYVVNPGYYTNGMALDAEGRLFVEPSTNDYGATSVERFRDMESGPVLGKTMTGSAFSAPTGLAIDYSQNFFVNDATLDQSNNRVNSYISVYHAYQSGNINPLWSFQNATTQLFWYGIAVDSGWVYTGAGQKFTGGTPTLEVFPKGSSGKVLPAFSQVIPAPDDPDLVAIGS